MSASAEARRAKEYPLCREPGGDLMVKTLRAMADGYCAPCERVGYCLVSFRRDDEEKFEDEWDDERVLAHERAKTYFALHPHERADEEKP